MKGLQDLRGLGAFRKLPQVLDAAEAISANLCKRGVPHVIVGGLAVVAYGWERGTADVDILVPAERRDIVDHGLRGASNPLRMREGLVGRSYAQGGVDIDVLAATEETILRPVLDKATANALLDPDTSLPIVTPEALVLLKMHAGRTRDKGDVIELLKRGALPVELIRSTLRQVGEDYLADFELCILEAEQEK